MVDIGTAQVTQHLHSTDGKIRIEIVASVIWAVHLESEVNPPIRK